MLEKYVRYSFEDFVQDEDFIKWAKSPDWDDELFWSEFLDTFPFKKEVVDQARQVVLNLKEASQPEVADEDAAEIWDSIQKSVAGQENVIPLWKRPWTIWAAAMLMLLSGIAAWQIVANKTNPVVSNRELFWPEISDKNATEVSNKTLRPMLVRLPDRSRVTLQPKGRLRYKHNFGGRLREVYLIGEAFFDVTHNTEKPFIVYANGLIAKVLGTSFNIKANGENEEVTVIVKTGKVSVFTPEPASSGDPETKGIILRPNQQASYTRGIEKLVKTIVAEPLPIEEIQQSVFVDTPVTEIFGTLEKVYGINILFDQELLAGCKLTSSFENESSLFEKLDVLCEATGATYKVVDAQIIINGKKCQ